MAVESTDALRRPIPRWLVGIGLLVTAAFTFLAVRDANLPDVWSALLESEKVWLVPAGAVLALAVYVRAARWWLLFTPGTRPSLSAAVHATLIGYFFNNVLPLRAGEPARVLAIHRRAGVSRAEAAGTVVVERVYDVLALLLLLFATVAWLPEVTWLKAAVILLLALVAGAALAIAILVRFGARPLRVVLRPLAWTRFFTAERVDTGAVRLAEGLAGLRRPRMAFEAGLATLVSWLLVALSFWLVMLCFDFGLSPLAGLLAVIAINLALILPSSPAAIGVFEWAAVIALDAYGVPRSEALSYALVAHALNFVPFVAVGAVLVTGRGRFGVPLSRVRLPALLLTAALLISSAVLVPLELRRVRNDIAVGERSTELERRAGGGVQLGLDLELLVRTERVVPETASFAVIVGPGVDPPTALTLDGIRQFAAYWLLPRRQAEDPAVADWVFSYGGDLESLGLDYRRIVRVAPGVDVAEVRR